MLNLGNKKRGLEGRVWFICLYLYFIKLEGVKWQSFRIYFWIGFSGLRGNGASGGLDKNWGKLGFWEIFGDLLVAGKSRFLTSFGMTNLLRCALYRPRSLVIPAPLSFRREAWNLLFADTAQSPTNDPQMTECGDVESSA